MTGKKHNMLLCAFAAPVKTNLSFGLIAGLLLAIGAEK